MKLVGDEGAKRPTAKPVKRKKQCDVYGDIADALLLDRLDDIHDDIKQLQIDVRGLQDDMLRHRTGAKVIVAIGSALIAIATWLWTQYWQLARHVI